MCVKIFLVAGPKRERNISKWIGSRRDLYFLKIYLFISSLRTRMFPAGCFRQRTCMAQGLVNWVLNETWTHSCLNFWVQALLSASIDSFDSKFICYNSFLVVAEKWETEYEISQLLLIERNKPLQDERGRHEPWPFSYRSLLFHRSLVNL